MKIIINTFDDYNHLIKSKILKVNDHESISEETLQNIDEFIEESAYEICEYCGGEGVEELYEDNTRQNYLGTRTCICQLQEETVLTTK